MPKTVREWTLTDEIGRGGMGVVYRATHSFLRGNWAVKVIRPELSEDAESRQRFMSEFTFLSSLRHPNIIDIQTPFEEAGQLYLPMELLTGRSLDVALKSERGPWPPEDAVNVVRQAANGLGHAHRHNPQILHRDIKPGNIQLLGDGRIKILDFGLAQSFDERSITGAGKAVGTPAYMAPEVLDGKKATARSDVYSLGIVMYRLLAGRSPYDLPEGDSSIQATFMAVARSLDRGLPDVCKFSPSTPPALGALVMQALSLDPGERPADGGWFAELLGAVNVVPGIEITRHNECVESADSTRLALDLNAMPRIDRDARFRAASSTDFRVSSDYSVASPDPDCSLLGIKVFDDRISHPGDSVLASEQIKKAPPTSSDSAHKILADALGPGAVEPEHSKSKDLRENRSAVASIKMTEPSNSVLRTFGPGLWCQLALYLGNLTLVVLTILFIAALYVSAGDVYAYLSEWRAGAASTVIYWIAMSVGLAWLMILAFVREIKCVYKTIRVKDFRENLTRRTARYLGLWIVVVAFNLAFSGTIRVIWKLSGGAWGDGAMWRGFAPVGLWMCTKWLIFVVCLATFRHLKKTVLSHRRTAPAVAVPASPATPVGTATPYYGATRVGDINYKHPLYGYRTSTGWSQTPPEIRNDR